MLTVINSFGKRKIGTAKDSPTVTFNRKKIVFGNYKLKTPEDKNVKGESLVPENETVAMGAELSTEKELSAGYPTLPELVQFYGGQVDILGKDGKEVESQSIVKDIVAGWNQTESNAAFGRSPAQAEATQDSAIAKLLKSMGKEPTAANIAKVKAMTASEL